MNSLNPSVLFLHCTDCLHEKPDGISPGDFGKTLVGVTDGGDLVVWCVRHDSAVAIYQNGHIDEAMRTIAGESCNGCGGNCKKETKH